MGAPESTEPGAAAPAPAESSSEAEVGLLEWLGQLVAGAPAPAPAAPAPVFGSPEEAAVSEQLQQRRVSLITPEEEQRLEHRHSKAAQHVDEDTHAAALWMRRSAARIAQEVDFGSIDPSDFTVYCSQVPPELVGRLSP